MPRGRVDSHGVFCSRAGSCLHLLQLCFRCRVVRYRTLARLLCREKSRRAVRDRILRGFHQSTEVRDPRKGSFQTLGQRP